MGHKRSCSGAFLLAASLLFSCDYGEEAGSRQSRDHPRGEGAEAAPLNVVLVTIDTMRADALGSYGQMLPSTPNLDRLAADGVRFDQVVTSAPSTLPSHATILTGRQPYVHGARSNSGYVLAHENVTLAEALGSNGYATGAEVAAQVIGERTQLDQGFDFYRDLESFDIVRKSIATPGEDAESKDLPEREASDITRRGIEFLRTHRNRKFFLWLHYFDPHRSWTPPASFRRMLPGQPYLAEVLYVDYHIGKLASEISRLGLRRRTLVIVTSDHGEGLGEHDEDTHSYFVYDTTMRVPLIFWGADEIPRGRVVESLVRTVDIAPTIVDLAGLPPLHDVQGRSLRPLLDGSASDLGLVGYGESVESFTTFRTAILRFVREGRWKYIHKVDPQLFDVQADPGELRDVAPGNPEVVERLRSTLHDMVAQAPAKPGGAEVAMDAEALAQLIALGYVGAGSAPDIPNELAALDLAGDDPATKSAEVRQFARAYGLIRTQRYEEAAAIFRSLWVSHLESSVLLYGLIRALDPLERDDEVIPLMRRAIELDPGFVDFYLQLAVKTQDQGNVEEAESLLRRAVELDPCGVKPRILLSNLLGTQRRYAEQLRLLEEGIDSCQDTRSFRNDYAYILASCPDDRLRDGERAVGMAEQAVAESQRGAPALLDTLAAAYAEVGRFDRAVEVSREAIALLERREMPEEVIATFHARLEGYEQGRPAREN
jgi:arylsulfatase A-like enzyme/Flp pilus assembly protein TadD